MRTVIESVCFVVFHCSEPVRLYDVTVSCEIVGVLDGNNSSFILLRVWGCGGGVVKLRWTSFPFYCIGWRNWNILRVNTVQMVMKYLCIVYIFQVPFSVSLIKKKTKWKNFWHYLGIWWKSSLLTLSRFSSSLLLSQSCSFSLLHILR